jgi:hypothetical protein
VSHIYTYYTVQNIDYYMSHIEVYHSGLNIGHYMCI